MKKLIFIICLIACSCTEPKQPSVVISRPEKQESVKETTKVNPAFLNSGSSFLNIFSCYWKLGQWDKLIELTDRQSINQFGKEKLIKAYQKTNLAMQLQLRSHNDNGDSTFTLNYSTSVIATRRIIRITVRLLPSDSVKLIVSDLKKIIE